MWRNERDKRAWRAVAGGLAALFGITALGCASSQGQEQDTEPRVIAESAPTASGQARGDIPAGTEIEIELDRPLSSESNNAGDPWRGVVTHDVTNGSSVLITRGAVVSGVVTRAGEAEIDGETRVILAIDPQQLEVGDAEYPIDAEIVEAEADENKELLDAKNVAIVGGSAAAGAVLGEILFDEALLGAVLGAAGGTVVAVATADTEIELDEGSRLTLRLEDEVRVAQRDR